MLVPTNLRSERSCSGSGLRVPKLRPLVVGFLQKFVQRNPATVVAMESLDIAVCRLFLAVAVLIQE